MFLIFITSERNHNLEEKKAIFNADVMTVNSTLKLMEHKRAFKPTLKHMHIYLLIILSSTWASAASEIHFRMKLNTFALDFV